MSNKKPNDDNFVDGLFNSIDRGLDTAFNAVDNMIHSAFDAVDSVINPPDKNDKPSEDEFIIVCRKQKP